MSPPTLTTAARMTPSSGPPNAVPRLMTTAARTTRMMMAVTESWSLGAARVKPLFVRVVAAVIREEGAEKADEADAGAALVEEALVVRPRHVEEEPADADPDRRQNRGEEREDERPGVPGPSGPFPREVGGG